MRRLKLFFALIAPGVLVAATGVGAGDLITASLAGSKLKLSILWACWVGAILKWYLNEGIARWQMATDTTLLEGWVARLGRWIQWVFLGYLLIWSVFVAAAIMSGLGVASVGLLGLTDSPHAGTLRPLSGIAFSLAGIALVWFGGYRVFEVAMAVCIGVMFTTVMATAILLPQTDWAGIGRGLVPSLIPDMDGQGLKWFIAVLGGVGGTVTLLSYGYWIRERDRAGKSGLRDCRLDLAVGYAMTALFGIAMMIIASRITLTRQSGTGVLVELGEQLNAVIPGGRWVFLIGAWGAIFSSLLGVWQSVPYLFADFLSLRRGQSSEERKKIDFDRTPAYRAYLLGIGILPIPLVWFTSLTAVQLSYAILGAMSMPLLALTLLLLNNRREWVGEKFRNNWVTNVVLGMTLAAFAFFAVYQIWSRLTG